MSERNICGYEMAIRVFFRLFGLVFTWPAIVVFLVLPAAPARAELTPVTFTILRPNAIAGTTFSSTTQKAVQNENGIFVTFADGSDPSGAQWFLKHSTDGGKTFQSLYSQINPTATGVPTLETDANNNTKNFSHFIVL